MNTKFLCACSPSNIIPWSSYVLAQYSCVDLVLAIQPWAWTSIIYSFVAPDSGSRSPWLVYSTWLRAFTKANLAERCFHWRSRLDYTITLSLNFNFSFLLHLLMRWIVFTVTLVYSKWSRAYMYIFDRARFHQSECRRKVFSFDHEL